MIYYIMLILGIVLFAVAASMGAARRRGRGRRRGIDAIPFSQIVDTTTIAADIVVTADAIPAAFTRKFFAVSVKCYHTARGGTVGEGPVQTGFAHGDYSDAEVAEQLVAEMTGTGNKTTQEQARRLVRKAGMMPMIAADEVLNNGNAVTTKLGFMIEIGQNLSVWARNRSGAAFANGPVVQYDGTIFGRWM